MIDASSGYMKDGNKNRLCDMDSQQAEDSQDIEGHLMGGLPSADVDDLQLYWEVCPNMNAKLFSPRPLGEGQGERVGYLKLAVPNQAIKTTIYEHPKFVTFIDSMNALFADWQHHSAETLKSLQTDCQSKTIIAELTEDLLEN
jgi:type I restriction enzyme M protein